VEQYYGQSSAAGIEEKLGRTASGAIGQASLPGCILLDQPQSRSEVPYYNAGALCLQALAFPAFPFVAIQTKAPEFYFINRLGAYVREHIVFKSSFNVISIIF
jgi:hypothetical protein